MKGAIKYRFITKASAAEATGIITIYRAQGWWPRGSRAGLNRLIRGSHCFLAAERNGKIVGIGRAISDGAGDAYLQDVAVLKAERGRGLGKGLVAALCRRLKRDGVNWIALIAQDGSAPFYSKLGFRPLPNALPMLIKGARV